jgi:hypothetical protein
MAEESKPDRITIVDAAKPPSSGNKAFRRVGSFSRDSDSGSLFFRSRTLTKERGDAESAYYDEGFDAPRESDFRQRQVFHGWKLFL